MCTCFYHVFSFNTNPSNVNFPRYQDASIRNWLQSSLFGVVGNDLRQFLCFLVPFRLVFSEDPHFKCGNAKDMLFKRIKGIYVTYVKINIKDSSEVSRAAEKSRYNDLREPHIGSLI